jgi:hypothetical protein
MQSDTIRWLVGGIAAAVVAVVGYEYASIYEPQKSAARLLSGHLAAIHTHIAGDPELAQMMVARNFDKKCSPFRSAAEDIHRDLDELDLIPEEHVGDFLIQNEGESRLPTYLIAKVSQLRTIARDGFGDAKKQLRDLPHNDSRLLALCDFVGRIQDFDSLSRETQNELDAIATQSFMNFLRVELADLLRV